MGQREDNAEIKEFTCSTCKKELEEVCLFGEYGTEKRKTEALKKKSYCEPCFDKKSEEL